MSSGIERAIEDERAVATQTRRWSHGCPVCGSEATEHGGTLTGIRHHCTDCGHTEHAGSAARARR